MGEKNQLQMDYINSSHPNFIGGSEAEEIALQQIKASRLPSPMSGHKACTNYWHFVLSIKVVNVSKYVISRCLLGCCGA